MMHIQTKQTLLRYVSFDFIMNDQSNRLNQQVLEQISEITDSLQAMQRQLLFKIHIIKNRVASIQRKLKQKRGIQGNQKLHKYKPIPKTNAKMFKMGSFDTHLFKQEQDIKQESTIQNTNAPEIDCQDQEQQDLDITLSQDLDISDIDLEQETQIEEDNTKLWEDFREIQMRRIKKSMPKESIQMIEQFIKKKWDRLSQRQRNAEVLSYKRKQRIERSKAINRQQLFQHNQNVKMKFEQLLQKKSRNNDKIEQRNNEPKIYATDLRGLIQKSKAPNNKDLDEKLKRIFQS